jgi:hypothetical protein
MFDLAKLNKTMLDTFAEKQLITLTHGGIDYQIKGIFTVGTDSVDDSIRNHNQPMRGVYTLEVSTKELAGIEFKKNDKATINGIEYKLDDSPLDVHGMTTLTLRK